MIIKEIKILLLGLEIGMFNENHIIDWVYRCVEYDETMPDELYEIPFVKEGKALKYRSILLECCRWNISKEDIKGILGLICMKVESGALTIDSALSAVYRLIADNAICDIEEEIEKAIHYFSDGYYLATSNIYGNAKEIEKEFKEWLYKFRTHSLDIKL